MQIKPNEKENEREIYSLYNKQMSVSKRCFLPARQQGEQGPSDANINYLQMFRLS
jgi:hypothetical protein